MPTWSKAALRTIGTIDAILGILGLYLFLDPISRGLFAMNAGARAPYFRIAFVTMLVTNGVLLLLFMLAAGQLLRLKKSGVTVHITASALLVGYNLLIERFWAAGGPIGMSIAAATGVGNLGIAPFDLPPCIYTIASTVLLLVSWPRMAARMDRSPHAPLTDSD
jgi:hypothetical protein